MLLDASLGTLHMHNLLNTPRAFAGSLDVLRGVSGLATLSRGLSGCKFETPPVPRHQRCLSDLQSLNAANLRYTEEKRHALRWRLSALFVNVLMTSEKKKQSLLKEFVTSGISVGTANIVTLPLGENERRGIF